MCLAVLMLTTGCDIMYRGEMMDQPKHKPWSPSPMFKDGRSSRMLEPGVVARGHLHDDDHYFTGKVQGKLVTALPYALTKKVLERGQQQFNVFCSPCHDRTGGGWGMIVQRGYKQPPSFHVSRLKEAPIGHFFDVATNGYGNMPTYAPQVSVKDRWAIAAYIRALQLSQSIPASSLSPEEVGKIEERDSE